jgi:predicted GNAT family acetyltransferase
MMCDVTASGGRRTTQNGLDDPIWAALTTEHARFAEGSGVAKRYAPDISPFAGIVDQSAAARAALRALVPTDGRVALFAPETIKPPLGLEIERTASMEQMIATQEPQAEAPGTDIVHLSAIDAEEMRALVALTNPGPFGARTHVLGRFLGIRLNKQLVAMAGERLRFPGHVEISGICVHPGHRHKGYARFLITAVVRRAIQDGLVPFLHVYSDNAAAIALYKRLKFEVRRQLRVTVLRHTQ